MSRLFAALLVAVVLTGCETMTHLDGNTVSFRHEHMGNGWQGHLGEMAAAACRQSGRSGAELLQHAPARPGQPQGWGATVSTYRCT
jgi:hypothetical protein